MSSKLIELNSLIKSQQGVWVNQGQLQDFAYSDGNHEEQYLLDLFANTSDLSVDSPQLADAVRDWASLYHLSANRANVLKNIVLPPKANILELGCGCGAITRYLAEQGHHVTAVEGSFRRAEIARLRNQDLTQVNVVCANFNEVQFPAQHYDAILFIGVLEYAKRFSNADDITAEQAVSGLLEKAKAALSENGKIIVAIENRLGLKYQQGALEDHLALKDAGINDYVGYEFTGIKTFDYSQWHALIEQVDLHGQFYFPFPDYKLPQLVIAGSNNTGRAAFLSSQINSSDPISPWQMPQPEADKWQQIFADNQLNEQANSYGIVLTHKPQASAELFKQTWQRYDNPLIKPHYRIDTKSALESVERSHGGMTRIHQAISNCHQTLLLNRWNTALYQNPAAATLIELSEQFVSLVQQYKQAERVFDLDYLYVAEHEGQPSLQPLKFWQTERSRTVEQHLFHWLLEFCLSQRKSLLQFNELNGLSIDELIKQIFTALKLDYAGHRADLIDAEQAFIAKISLSELSVSQQLNQLFSNRDQYQFNFVHPKLYYARAGEGFSEANSLEFTQKQAGLIEVLDFYIPDSAFTVLRFDPCDHQFGEQHYLRLVSIKAFDHVGQMLHGFDLQKALAAHDLEPSDQVKRIFKVTGVDPQFLFNLSEDLLAQVHGYNLRIELQWLGK